MADDEEKLSTIFGRERRHDESLVRATACRGNESFLLQSVQGTADGCPAQPETLRYDALGDARTRSELAPDDQAAQLIVHERNVGRGRLGCRPSGGNRHRAQDYRSVMVDATGAL